MKTKTFQFVSLGSGYVSIAVLNWGRATNQFTKKDVFVKYVYAFDQSPFESDPIPQILMDEMTAFCKAKGLNLYSY